MGHEQIRIAPGALSRPRSARRLRHGHGRRRAVGASVTRFHLGQPIARGPIAIEPADPADANSLEFDADRGLGRARAHPARLDGRAGQRPLRAGRRWSASTRARGPARRRGGLSIGIGVGGGSYGRRSGVGVGVGGTIPVGGTRRPGGRHRACACASSAAPTPPSPGRAGPRSRRAAARPLAGRAGAADRLAAALFRDFPGESGRTIRVR